MLNLKEKELFDKKISYSDDLFLRCLYKANIPTNKEVVIYLAFWNSPRGYYKCKKLFPKADIKVVEALNLKDLYNIPTSDTIYIDTDKEKFPMIKELKDIYIIANPPYSRIGANITKSIIDNVDFKEYVNLLPANDYKRNTTKDLYRYQSEMEPIINGFADAAVTTHLARIHRTKVNNMTLDEFERSNYIDKSLDKYFIENSKRVSTVEDKYLPSRELVRSVGPERSLIFTKRDVNHKHLPYSKKVNSYKWNVEASITADYLIENTAVDFNNAVSVEMLICKTAFEKTNQANFYYSKDGFRFLSKIFTAVNVDSRIELNKILPKVDWTRSWTVEDILRDYGYTDEEITEVMNDLNNFKGMKG
jgi:hypothetical protein